MSRRSPATRAAGSVAEHAHAGQDKPGDAGEVALEHRDEELTFCLQVFRDRALARACLESVRRAYPGARVVVVSDGDDDPRWPALAARHAAEYVRGERLYAVERGGLIVARLLALHLRRPTPWLFRIDTDTRVHRRFRFLPRGACVFGTLERRTWAHHEPLDPPVVQGGCMGFTLEAVRRLHAARVFEAPELRDWAATWADTRDARERARGGRVSFDHLVRHGCRRAGVEARAFDEVCSCWRGRVPNPGLRYAVTHPHKHWWQLPRLWVSLRLSRLLAARRRA
jgi:hypothetical protein